MPSSGLPVGRYLVIQHEDGGFVPLEDKATHLFVGYHEAHGRPFDTVQAIAECRLVHTAFGRRPTVRDCALR